MGGARPKQALVLVLDRINRIFRIVGGASRADFGTGWGGWLGYFLGFKSTAVIGKDIKDVFRGVLSNGFW